MDGGTPDRRRARICGSANPDQHGAALGGDDTICNQLRAHNDLPVADRDGLTDEMERAERGRGDVIHFQARRHKPGSRLAANGAAVVAHPEDCGRPGRMAIDEAGDDTAVGKVAGTLVKRRRRVVGDGLLPNQVRLDLVPVLVVSAAAIAMGKVFRIRVLNSNWRIHGLIMARCRARFRADCDIWP